MYLEILQKNILYLRLDNIVRLLLLYRQHITIGLYLRFSCIFYQFIGINYHIIPLRLAEALLVPTQASELQNVHMKNRIVLQVHRHRSLLSKVLNHLNINNHQQNVNVFMKWTTIELSVS